jgi:release factor glutamine methyltransferase
MRETWTVRKVLGWTTDRFEQQLLDAPRLTAELLLAHALRTDRLQLYLDLERPLQADELAGVRALIRRRTNGTPTQYLTGSREFYGRPFCVDPRVLIPRPETELLVEEVLQIVPDPASVEVLDVGTGSGCIAATLAAERSNASVWATEISSDACEVARLNLENLGLSGRVKLLKGDLFAPIPLDQRFDVIVSNPPYVASHEVAGLSTEVRQEPLTALDGGEDGLAVIRRLIEQSKAFLKPGGLLAFEISETHGPAVLNLLTSEGYREARISKDLARLDRFAHGTVAR